MTDVPGWHLHGMHRDGTRRYRSRPPANCRSAREAWDEHAKDGPIVWLQLLDGYWGACRENGDIDEVENVFAANRWLPSDGPVCERCDGEGAIQVEDRPYPTDISPTSHSEPCPERTPSPRPRSTTQEQAS